MLLIKEKFIPDENVHAYGIVSSKDFNIKILV
jgi:hypothetical protein